MNARDVIIKPSDFQVLANDKFLKMLSCFKNNSELAFLPSPSPPSSLISFTPPYPDQTQTSVNDAVSEREISLNRFNGNIGHFSKINNKNDSTAKLWGKKSEFEHKSFFTCSNIPSTTGKLNVVVIARKIQCNYYYFFKNYDPLESTLDLEMESQLVAKVFYYATISIFGKTWKKWINQTSSKDLWNYNLHKEDSGKFSEGVNWQSIGTQEPKLLTGLQSQINDNIFLFYFDTSAIVPENLPFTIQIGLHDYHSAIPGRGRIKSEMFNQWKFERIIIWQD